MAKSIRSIKVDLRRDETLGRLSRDARYLFVLLFGTYVDDHGRFRANPALLRGELYPYDEDVAPAMVSAWLEELVHAGRVQLYVAQGQQYGVVVSWAKHQRIDNAARSELPEPPAAGPPAGNEPAEVGGEPPHSAASGGEPPPTAAGKERKGKENYMSPSGDCGGAVARIFDAWRDSTGKRKAVLDHKRKKVIAGALRLYPEDELIEAVSGWNLDPHSRGENERHTVYNELDLLLRDAAHIEKYRDLSRHGEPTTNGSRAHYEHLSTRNGT